MRITAAPAPSALLVEAGTCVERVFIGKLLTMIGAGPETIVEYPTTGFSDSGVIEIRESLSPPRRTPRTSSRPC